jgi:hypothetical protein
MSLWERLLDWLGLGKRQATLRDPAGAEVVAVEKATEPSAIQQKVTTTMLNSITLSSDMETLYLIDNGRAIPFDLNHPKGILVGTLGAQLVVATAVDKPNATEEPTTGDPGGGGDAGPVDGGGGTVAARPKPRTEIKFPVVTGQQWTIFYNDHTGILAIIGVTDINGSIAEPDINPSTKGALFKIRNARPINIQRKGNVLLIQETGE